MAYRLQRPIRTLSKELLLRKSKALSFILYRFKWNFFPKIGFVSQYPLHVDIEVTNRCNLKCTMCIKSSEKDQGNQGDIDLSMAYHILEAIGGKVYSVKFNWRGEPLLYKNLPQLVAYAKFLGIPEVQINTNAILLDKNTSRALINAGLDRIIISIDGHSAKTYESIRVGGSYGGLLNNIHTFLQEKKFYKTHSFPQEKKFHKTHFPIVRVQMCVGKENIHEKESFIRYWLSRGVQVGIIEKQDRLKEEGEKHNVSDLSFFKQCKQPWQRLTISWEGKVFPCCADWNQRSPLSWKIFPPMKSEEIRNILQLAWKEGLILNKIRKGIQTRNIKNILCSHCPSVIGKMKEK